MFASELGVKPWEIDQLSVQQIEDAVSLFDERLKEKSE